MAFLKLIFKNIFRQKWRTILTVLGISLGIGTIVTLGILTGGLKQTLEKTIKTGEADFSVAEAKVADFAFSKITEKQLEKMRDTEGIKEAVGVLFGFAQTQQNPFFILYGIKSKETGLLGVDLTKGRTFKESKNEIVIGKIAAENMKLKVGDKLPVKERSYKIVGIFQTGNPMQDGGALISLKKLQAMERKKSQVTIVLVKVTEQVKDIEKFADDFEEKFGNQLVTLVSVEDYSSVDQGLTIIDFLSSAISILAVVIGGIGVMNTIMMSVFERTREIGILRAIGWKRRRVLSMILGESLLLGILSIIIGTILGLLVIQYIMTFPVAQSFFRPDYSPQVFVNAIVVGILVSLVGGFYPAFRATRFSPAVALRYE